VATRRDFDWRKEWREWQPDDRIDNQRRPEIEAGDWRAIPTQLIEKAPAAGRRRLFVLQTCCWHEQEDEGWWEVDGVALRAYRDRDEAEREARRQQTIRGERLGVVETETDRSPDGELYLVVDVDGSHGRRADLSQGQIVAAFANRYEAEQDALDRERSDWHHACEEGWYNRNWTSLPPELIGDLFLDLGVPAPPSEAEHGYEAVWHWWRQTAPHMDGWQRERLRLAMDRFSRYRVVPVPMAE